MGSSDCAGEMCFEGGGGGGRAGRRGGKKAAAAAAEQKVPKQPQRGLGVAQLEKIRLQNQMIAAYRSGMQRPPQQQQQVPFAGAAPMAGAASFQPYLTDCFEAMDRRIADARYSQYYAENLLPYSSGRSPATPLFVRDAKDSSSSSSLGQRQQPPPQYYWMSSSHESSGRSSTGIGSEELDLELRL